MSLLHIAVSSDYELLLLFKFLCWCIFLFIFFLHFCQVYALCFLGAFMCCVIFLQVYSNSWTIFHIYLFSSSLLCILDIVIVFEGWSDPLPSWNWWQIKSFVFQLHPCIFPETLWEWLWKGWRKWTDNVRKRNCYYAIVAGPHSELFIIKSYLS